MPGQRKNKRARALVDRLMTSGKPGPMPLGSPSPADVIRYLMDQHGLKRADLVPLLGSAEQVDDILRGRRKLTLTIVQRLRARFPRADRPSAARSAAASPSDKKGDNVGIISQPRCAGALRRARQGCGLVRAFVFRHVPLASEYAIAWVRIFYAAVRWSGRFREVV